MSDEVAVSADVEPQVGSTVSSSEVSQTPDVPMLSVQDYAEYRVPVKMDGEELHVPLTEALAGYQRQSDYTRKTQELSQQREQLQFASALESALQRDPEATIDMLTRHYGISRQAATNMVDDFDVESMDPRDLELQQLNQRVSAFEEYKSQQEIEREVSRLQSKYQDFDVNEVVTTALRLNTTDLESTYKQLAFDKIMARQETERLAKERQSQVEAGVVQAKREASVVSGGSSASNTTSAEPNAPITSLRDAWAAAKNQLNASL